MGLILDSSVAIAAERRGDSIQAFLQRVIDTAGDQEAALSTTETYSSATGTWQSQPSMLNARSRFRLVLLSNGDALASGGRGFQFLSVAERFSY